MERRELYVGLTQAPRLGLGSHAGCQAASSSETTSWRFQCVAPQLPPPPPPLPGVTLPLAPSPGCAHRRALAAPRRDPERVARWPRRGPAQLRLYIPSPSFDLNLVKKSPAGRSRPRTGT